MDLASASITGGKAKTRRATAPARAAAAASAARKAASKRSRSRSPSRKAASKKSRPASKRSKSPSRSKSPAKKAPAKRKRAGSATKKRRATAGRARYAAKHADDKCGYRTVASKKAKGSKAAVKSHMSTRCSSRPGAKNKDCTRGKESGRCRLHKVVAKTRARSASRARYAAKKAAAGRSPVRARKVKSLSRGSAKTPKAAVRRGGRTRKQPKRYGLGGGVVAAPVKASGDRFEVMYGLAKHTSGGLTKKDLVMRGGKIVSKRASAAARKMNNLGL